MKDQEIRYNNARIRVHFPDRSKEEQSEKIRKATESFVKKVMQKRARKESEHEKNHHD